MAEQTFSTVDAKAQDRLLNLQRDLAAATLPSEEALPDSAHLWRLITFPFTLLAALVALGVLFAFVPGAYAVLIASEQGIIENATPVIALAGVWFAVQLVRVAPPSPAHWLKIWYAVIAVGMLFIAGEEISWGQQWFFWATPDWIADVNTQQETNLHNLSQLTENLPKLLLTIGVYATGLAYPPWVLRYGPLDLIRKTPLNLIWPSAALWASAAIALKLRLVERVLAWCGGFRWNDAVFRTFREGLEIFLVLFLTLYLFDMLRRYRRLASDGRKA